MLRQGSDDLFHPDREPEKVTVSFSLILSRDVFDKIGTMSKFGFQIIGAFLEKVDRLLPKVSSD